MKVIVTRLDLKEPNQDLESEWLPKKEKKKKSWKERQRERQRAQEAESLRHEVARKYEKRRGGWPKGKIIFGVCVLVLVFIGYGAWRHFDALSQLPPVINGGDNNPPPTGSAPNFSLRDISGNLFSLNQHSGKVIAIHFMAVGCHGQIYPINDNQLRQLKSTCTSHCSNKPVTMVTVAVATCPSSDLASIRANYGITWALGNDYDDYKLDIVDAYKAYSIYDGTIIIIDKTFNVAKVYNEATTADTLSSKINQLLAG
jgi:hypothetical protein